MPLRTANWKPRKVEESDNEKEENSDDEFTKQDFFEQLFYWKHLQSMR